jgi:hypothetical protein
MKTRGKSAGIRSETTSSESAKAAMVTCIRQLTVLSPGVGEELSGAKRKRFLNSVTDAIDTLVSLRETLGGPLPVSFSPAPHQESLHQHWLLSRLIEKVTVMNAVDRRNHSHGSEDRNRPATGHTR